ncbi:MAG: bifunctional 2-polyprenyl-6-hydroxyphenol methylase/3-demethylubiquinol 3-O-methyltransferase UbiG [Desulfobacterales bacterium]|nr:bifunctional 2-polyprenyl-6-hydroxyphenol methylase/3-demethylubiquinol 3-O-methyltransferase UbiG [Desulfobacterales bacterium]
MSPPRKTRTAELNVDTAEIAKFEAVAARWWEPGGAFQALHDINPLRLGYIRQRADLARRRVLDVGCGGGILSEALAREGAAVTGIDLGAAALAAAQAHQRLTGVPVSYRRIAVETLAVEQPAAFDVVVCMELLEHVPDPAAVVAACARLARPGGDVFFATLNRTVGAYLLAIVMAETILRIVPAGTHQYRRFIRPRDLDDWAHNAGLGDGTFHGMLYLPFVRRAFVIRSTAVNYLAHFKRT